MIGQGDRGEVNFSHFGPEANLLDELATSFNTPMGESKVDDL